MVGNQMKQYILLTILGVWGVTFVSGCGKSETENDEAEVKTAEAPVEVVSRAAAESNPSEDIQVDASASSKELGADQVSDDIVEEIVEKEAVVEDSVEAKDVVVENEEVAAASAPTEGAGLLIEPSIVESEGVMLNSIILARGVDKREPVSPGTAFSVAEGEKIYAILDVKNPGEEMAGLTVSWKMPNSEKEIGKFNLEVKPAKTWRTWSFTRYAKKLGRWEAVVRNAEDEVIARAPFDVTE